MDFVSERPTTQNYYYYHHHHHHHHHHYHYYYYYLIAKLFKHASFLLRNMDVKN